MDKPLSKLAEGFRGRTLKTVKMLTKTGLGLARRSVAGRKATAHIDEDKAVAAAEALLGELDGMKGLAMKFGQLASYLDHTLPPKARAVLARLQSESRPMAPELVRQIVRADLGEDPEGLFDDFEPQPFAAASIGQVHRARLGELQVAVKVQYPGIAKALESDIKTLERLTRLGFLVSRLDGKALVAELRDRVLEECDYLREARNQTLFAELFGSDPQRDVPRVVPERSSAHVLTSHFVDRQRFQRFVRDAPPSVRDRAGEIIFETCFGTLFHHCVFNADPHPGNYLFGDDGHVTFLDFGCLKWFTADFIDRWKGLVRCVLDGDRARFPDRFVDVGLVATTEGFDWDFQWHTMRALYAPYLAGRPTTYTGEEIERVNDLMTFANPNKYKFQVPRDWLFLNRLQFGLHSVLALLGSSVDFGPPLRRAIESETKPIVRDWSPLP